MLVSRVVAELTCWLGLVKLHLIFPGQRVECDHCRQQIVMLIQTVGIKRVDCELPHD